jgi:hypothetical protein
MYVTFLGSGSLSEMRAQIYKNPEFGREIATKIGGLCDKLEDKFLGCKFPSHLNVQRGPRASNQKVVDLCKELNCFGDSMGDIIAVDGMSKHELWKSNESYQLFMKSHTSTREYVFSVYKKCWADKISDYLIKNKDATEEELQAKVTLESVGCQFKCPRPTMPYALFCKVGTVPGPTIVDGKYLS